MSFKVYFLAQFTKKKTELIVLEREHDSSQENKNGDVTTVRLEHRFIQASISPNFSLKVSNKGRSL